MDCSYRCCLVVLFAVHLCFLALSAQCRPFEYSKPSSYLVVSQISASPSPAPEAAAAASQPPSPQVSVFSVVSYGAVGDGVADDTQAFKVAWDAACQADDPAVLLVPRHYTFMIQSTIFTGPCTSRLVLQVVFMF
ncbi:UNVERIFIED_CONTAM: putative polygalacturonase [Sesamum angustifolium]|uniref:Polygalacturonase n=1 Tax=Sesamum angustifolium TaxID=2727405 RepID=A0AAW2NWA6_9LAMI